MSLQHIAVGALIIFGIILVTVLLAFINGTDD
jgi:hypothetical protein